MKFYGLLASWFKAGPRPLVRTLRDPRFLLFLLPWLWPRDLPSGSARVGLVRRGPGGQRVHRTSRALETAVRRTRDFDQVVHPRLERRRRNTMPSESDVDRCPTLAASFPPNE